MEVDQLPGAVHTQCMAAGNGNNKVASFEADGAAVLL